MRNKQGRDFPCCSWCITSILFSEGYTRMGSAFFILFFPFTCLSFISFWGKDKRRRGFLVVGHGRQGGCEREQKKGMHKWSCRLSGLMVCWDSPCWRVHSPWNNYRSKYVLWTCWYIFNLSAAIHVLYSDIYILISIWMSLLSLTVHIDAHSRYRYAYFPNADLVVLCTRNKGTNIEVWIRNILFIPTSHCPSSYAFFDRWIWALRNFVAFFILLIRDPKANCLISISPQVRVLQHIGHSMSGIYNLVIDWVFLNDLSLTST